MYDGTKNNKFRSLFTTQHSAPTHTHVRAHSFCSQMNAESYFSQTNMTSSHARTQVY